MYTILQEYISKELNILDNTDKYKCDIETEKYYYKKIFNDFYKNCDNILPYYWMPKYTTTTDPSARTLEFY